MERLVTIQVWPNSRVADAATVAVACANSIQEPVVFRFSGVPALVRPGDSVDGVLAEWNGDYDKKMLWVRRGLA